MFRRNVLTPLQGKWIGWDGCECDKKENCLSVAHSRGRFDVVWPVTDREGGKRRQDRLEPVGVKFSRTVLFCAGNLKSHGSKHSHPFSHLRSCDRPNNIKSSSITNRIYSPYNFSIHWNQLSHHEDGGSRFLRNVKKFHQLTIRKATESSSGQLRSWDVTTSFVWFPTCSPV